VSTVEGTGDIRRRDDNDKGSSVLDLAILRELGLEEALLLPPIVPRRLDNFWDVGFVECIV